MKFTPAKRTAIKARFLRYVDKRRPNECWPWKGSISSSGYGEFRVEQTNDQGPTGAHRVAWEIKHGAIPRRKIVCHSCDKHRCVNTAHMFVGSHADNSRDMVVKGRSRRGTSHWNARFSEDEIRAIRSAAPPYSRIAAKFKTNTGTISDIRNRKAWNHVK